MFNPKDAFTSACQQQSVETAWQQISPMYMQDESAYLAQLLPLARFSAQENKQVQASARSLIEAIRADKKSVQLIDSLLLEYSLDTEEGILLMCLAEALMRVPDKATADALIKDKLGVADWKAHLKRSDSVFVNASTWGLMLTGKVVGLKQEPSPTQGLNRLLHKMSEPVIRNAMNQAMKIMGHQFVLGQTMAQAYKNGNKSREQGHNYSYDMLGEAALTLPDAQKYFHDYMQAIEFIGEQAQDTAMAPSISIKLSALHPRYEAAQEARVLSELYHQVESLILHARRLNVALTIDAEEADRLEISLKLFEKLYTSESVKGWGGFGLVVQAYSKRALPVLVWLNQLAKQQGDKIPVRLVKGAYWDSEIKWSQQAGYQAYPVFTRKEATDVSYLVCARFLLSEYTQGHIYPQFATHNAHTLAAISVIAQQNGCDPQTDFEFQRLHGMGEALYQHATKKFNSQLRIYAPVGSHKDLLPYLVRRLLENGANSSFVHRLVDAKCPIDDLIQDPAEVLASYDPLHNEMIPLPPDLFGDRQNSRGINIDIESESVPFTQSVMAFKSHCWQAVSIINGIKLFNNNDLDLSLERHEPDQDRAYESMIKEAKVRQKIMSPFDHQRLVGEAIYATEQEAIQAIECVAQGQAKWQAIGFAKRAECLRSLADLLEKNMPELVALCHFEAGKTIHDSIDEVREAVDFCRYYASQKKTFEPYTIDFNKEITLQRQGLGVFVCISPWNFPLAIFLGQITAALVAGNTVVAKPAPQTTLIATRAVELMLEAGVAKDAIALVIGATEIGQVLTQSGAISGVAFTGSTLTAQKITQSLAQRENCLPARLIAETGGQNAMIVDSSALPEQVVRDVLRSAFASAGQRCSALRVLYVQKDIRERIISLIQGAMMELQVGAPYLHATDVGPVIDEAAREKLDQHIQTMSLKHKLISKLILPNECAKGSFVAPSVIEIEHISQIEEEKFGPILHLITYQAQDLPKVVEEINQTGFGLTLGVHSRNETTYRYIESEVKAGNSYINRDQVGAVVGVQPFGGLGLSGTGPKAGGPHYLQRFSQVTNDASGLLESVTLDQVFDYQIKNTQDKLVTKTMPGPTGERNELYFIPRGASLIYFEMPQSPDLAKQAHLALAAYVAASLSAGNSLTICLDDEKTQTWLQTKLMTGQWASQCHFVNCFAIEAQLDQGCKVLTVIGSLQKVQALNLALKSRMKSAKDEIIHYVYQLLDEDDLLGSPQESKFSFFDPDLFLNFVIERTRSINITAVGGNASLLAISQAVQK